MPFDSAPRELYGLVEEKLGGWVARLLLITFVGGAIAAGLGAVGLVAYQAHTKAIQPMLAALPAMPQGAASTALISTVVTTVLLLVPVTVLGRYLRTRELRLFRHVDAFLSGRLENIELRLDDMEASGRERFSYFQSQIETLQAPRQPTTPQLPAKVPGIIQFAPQSSQQPLAGADRAPVVAGDQRLNIRWKPHSSGLIVSVTNLVAKEIVNPRLQIADARRWSETAADYVKTQEVTVIELPDHPTLYCDQAGDFRCFYLAGEKLRAEGHLPLDTRSPSTLDLRGAGQWRVTFKLKWDQDGGGRADFSLALRWDGHGLPIPA